MNFQFLPHVYRTQHYLDRAFSEARANKAEVAGMRSEVNKARKKEIQKITSVNEYLSGEFSKIIQKFPRVDDLPEFYQKLILCYFSIDAYKEHLGGVRWTLHRIIQLSNIYGKEVKTSTDASQIPKMATAYYGRVCSVVKRIEQHLIKLSEMRSFLKNLPDVKENYKNVALFGFPNVGKSTLLSLLTPAKPEIAAYAFTTKQINVGYTDTLQCFDTPGTLNRFEKMNLIERQAHLVVTLLADIVVYVCDPTESYTLEEQKSLFEHLKRMTRARLIVYASKTDIASAEQIILFKKAFDCVDLPTLEKELNRKE
jgi:nucleolar GTP-binding protein